MSLDRMIESLQFSTSVDYSRTSLTNDVNFSPVHVMTQSRRSVATPPLSYREFSEEIHSPGQPRVRDNTPKMWKNPGRALLERFEQDLIEDKENINQIDDDIAEHSNNASILENSLDGVKITASVSPKNEVKQMDDEESAQHSHNILQMEKSLDRIKIDTSTSPKNDVTQLDAEAAEKSCNSSHLEQSLDHSKLDSSEHSATSFIHPKKSPGLLQRVWGSLRSKRGDHMNTTLEGFDATGKKWEPKGFAPINRTPCKSLFIRSNELPEIVRVRENDASFRSNKSWNAQSHGLLRRLSGVVRRASGRFATLSNRKPRPANGQSWTPSARRNNAVAPEVAERERLMQEQEEMNRKSPVPIVSRACRVCFEGANRRENNECDGPTRCECTSFLTPVRR